MKGDVVHPPAVSARLGTFGTEGPMCAAWFPNHVAERSIPSFRLISRRRPPLLSESLRSLAVIAMPISILIASYPSSSHLVIHSVSIEFFRKTFQSFNRDLGKESWKL